MTAWIALVASLLMLLTATATADELRPAKPAPEAVSGIALLVDVTGSLDVPATKSRTRRELYMDGARTIIRTAEQSKLPLTVGRLCGLAETLWGPAPVVRRDYASVTSLILTGLNSCAPSSTTVKSARRAGGTDIVAGLRWVARRPAGALVVAITDGLHEPPGSRGLMQAELHAALDQLPQEVRGRLWIIGVDEAVRDEIAARVPRTYGVFDFGRAVEVLAHEIKEKR